MKETFCDRSPWNPNYILGNITGFKEEEEEMNTIRRIPYKDIVEMCNSVNCPALKNDFSLKKIICNGPATIFFWSDGTKTIIKDEDGIGCTDEEDLYNAFCIAFTKKVFADGHNVRIHNAIKRAKVIYQDSGDE